MRSSDWSSDVCSSDLLPRAAQFLDELLIRVRADQGLQFIELDAVGDTLWDFVSDCAKQSITGVGRCGAISGLRSTLSGTCSAIGEPGAVHAARTSDDKPIRRADV